MSKNEGPKEQSSGSARTQVDATLAAAQQRHAGDPERAELIARTRRFKSSWIELAEALTECRNHKRFLKWNYRSFEDYYRRELHLKSATVDKLTGSYVFLKHAAPEVLKRDGVDKDFPSWQAVDFWRKAEEAAQNGQADPETVADVKRAVVEDNLPLPKITRLYRETLFPGEPDAEQKKRLKEAGRTARKLADLLEPLRDALPEAVLTQVAQAVTALLRALPVDDKEPEGGDKHKKVAVHDIGGTVAA